MHPLELQGAVSNYNVPGCLITLWKAQNCHRKELKEKLQIKLLLSRLKKAVYTLIKL